MRAARRLGIILTQWAIAASASAGLLDDLRSVQPDEGLWVEETVTSLPELPKQSTLVAVRLEGDARHEYFIDPRSLSVGRDGVVRFGLVVKTRGGTQQSSYAGVHCARQEWKTYAVAADDGKWRSVTKPSWKLIEKKRSDSMRLDLYRYYLCIDKTPVSPSERILANLRRGLPPRSGR